LDLLARRQSRNQQRPTYKLAAVVHGDHSPRAHRSSSPHLVKARTALPMTFSVPSPDQAQAADPPGATPFRAPHLVGRHVVLRPVLPEDYRFLRVAETSGDLGIRWRYRGSAVSPDQWAQHFWQNVLSQYLVIGTRDPTPLGLVVAYRASFQDGHVCLGVESFSSRPRSPALIFGACLFVEHVFTCWDFHKLYMEVAEYNLHQFQSGIGQLFELEGRLREHTWYDGKRWDQLFLALYRTTWRERGVRLLRAAQRPPELRARVSLPPRQGPPAT
jgi:hypothetical protein